MDFEELKKLIALMNKNDLVELELESKDTKVRLKKATPPAPVYAPMPMPMAPMPAQSQSSGAFVTHHNRADSSRDAHAPVLEGGSITFNSPMVGTFYSSPAPGADSFVKVGERVGPKTVLCIIEAMKVMNEITAETEGEILEFLVGNGEAVEFGQPLFTIRPQR